MFQRTCHSPGIYFQPTSPETQETSLRDYGTMHIHGAPFQKKGRSQADHLLLSIFDMNIWADISIQLQILLGSGNHLILKRFSDTCKIGIISCDAHQKIFIILDFSGPP